MSGHFAAFSFVDRITEYEPGQRAYGGFKVPATITAFPSCLVAEAVGQLAAWVAMAHVGFRARPVAALALETRFVRDVMPGSALELAVALDSCDDAAVAYSGHARVDGATVIELHDCLGPMLDIEQFESPAVLRDRFALLCGAGAEPGRFQGVMTPNLMVTTDCQASRYAQLFSFRPPRLFSPTISRAGPCIRRHFYSSVRSNLRCGSQEAQPNGTRASRSLRCA